MRLIEFARAAGAVGIRGEVRVIAHWQPVDEFYAIGMWHLLSYPRVAGETPTGLRVRSLRVLPNEARVLFEGIDTREKAMAVKGSLFVERSLLPEPTPDAYYPSDIEGFEVTGRNGVLLGRVTGVASNGAHDLIAVRDGQRVFHIPRVPAYITGIDFARGAVRADWEKDWL